MQTSATEFEQHARTPNLAAELAENWRSFLAKDCPMLGIKARESIIRWLLGNNLERFELLDSSELAIAQQSMEYRYHILRQRYLEISPQQAYRRLTNRLGSVVLLRNKIRALVALSQDPQQTLVEVLQEVVQELLQRDRYMQQQITWIAECTKDSKLRTALLLTTTEEYCLRPIRNQPLLAYRFVNYLRRTQQGGITQVPNNSLLRLISDEPLVNEGSNQHSFSDSAAMAMHQNTQALEEQQALRMLVQQEFSCYLAANLGTTAVQWLHLYLQGKSQEASAQRLNLSIKEVYRLREKISSHAVRVFGLKQKQELVSSWLEASLVEHSFGLTPQQWQQFWTQLTPRQRQVLQLKKAGQNLEAIAQVLNHKINQVTNEWHKLCLTAHAVRSQS